MPTLIPVFGIVLFVEFVIGVVSGPTHKVILWKPIQRELRIRLERLQIGTVNMAKTGRL